MRHVTALAVFTLYCGAAFLPLSAAEPLSWERKPNRPAPAQFDVFHGESLDFSCTFTGFGALPFAGASDVRLWYQTNGMGAAWWSIPATVSSNVLAATFTPDRDPGAERLSVFFGAPSNAYASASVRFRHSPGFTPNALPPPFVLDWAEKLADATNALAVSSAAAFMARSDAYTKAETDARIVELSPTPDMSGVVHGDDRAADKDEFEAGLKFRMADADGGDMRFWIEDPNDNGISWYSQSSGTTIGSPFLRFNLMGIRHPTDNANNPYKTTSWWDFSRAHTVLDLVSGSGVGGGGDNRPYPVSAGAFLDYIWGMQDLPTAAANNFADKRMMKAASNLVDRTGALVKAEDIEARSAMLTATSTVPVYAYSEWETDWPSDDEAQPTQPVFTNGEWYVWMVDGGWRGGPFTVSGSEGDTNLVYTLYSYATRFWRTATVSGDLNAYGLARLSDVTNEVYSFGRWEWGIGTGGSFSIDDAFQPVYNREIGAWEAYGGESSIAEITGTAAGGEDAISITFPYDYDWSYTSESGTITATRTRTKVNALGFAKRSDVTNIVNKAYVESLGIESGVSEATVTNVVRSIAYAVNDYVWDGDVCWRRQMLQGGYLEYVAVTNIDVTLPENYKALEALEKARRNQE